MAENDETCTSELSTETLVAGLGTIADRLRSDGVAVSALYIREAAERLTRLTAELEAVQDELDRARASLRDYHEILS